MITGKRLIALVAIVAVELALGPAAPGQGNGPGKGGAGGNRGGGAARGGAVEAAEPAAIGPRHARPPNRKRARPTWAAAASLQLVRKAVAAHRRIPASRPVGRMAGPTGPIVPAEACVPRIQAAAIRLNKTIPMSERAREPAAATLRHGRAARPQSACRTWGVAAVRQLVRVRHQRVDRATQHGPAATVRARAIVPAPAGRNCPAPVAVVRVGVQAVAEILLAVIGREGINPAITGRAEASREPVDRVAVVPLRATLATSSAFLVPCSPTSVRANLAPIVPRSIVRRVLATAVDPVARAPIDRARRRRSSAAS